MTNWAEPVESARARRGAGLAKLLMVLALGGAAALWVAYQGLALRFPYSLDYGEAPLIDQAARLAGGANVYRADLAAPPFTISNYPPGYVAVLSAFVPWAGPAFWPGRLVSALSGLVAATLVGFIIAELTRDRLAALVAGGIFLAWPPVVLWSGLARIDLLALALSLGGLLVLVRWPQRLGALLWGGLLLVAAIYTRQSYALAAPLAAGVWLWSAAGLRRAVVLAGWVGGLSVAIFAAMEAATSGGFYLHVVRANVNPFSWSTVREHAHGLASSAWIMLALGLASLGATRAWNGAYAVAAPYLVGGLASALTIGKTGSNVNYLLELCAALALSAGVCVCAARRPVTPSLARAALFVAVAVQAGMLVFATITSFPGALPARRRQADELGRLARLVAEAEGPVLIDEQMGMVTSSGRRLTFQPFEMKQLADAGLWDQEPLLDAIRAGEYAYVILEDVPWLRERWTPEMFAAIEASYRLSEVIAGNKIYTPMRGAGR